MLWMKQFSPQSICSQGLILPWPVSLRSPWHSFCTGASIKSAHPCRRLSVASCCWFLARCTSPSVEYVQVEPKASRYLMPWRSLPRQIAHHQSLCALPVWVTSLSDHLWKSIICDSDLELLIFGFKPYQALFIVSAFQFGVCSVLCLARTDCLLWHSGFWETC